MKNGKLEEAERMYKEMLEIFPENEKIISNISLITFQKGEFDKTLNYCTKILKIIKSLKEKINFKKYDSSFEVYFTLLR